jgi:hypothetical protein
MTEQNERIPLKPPKNCELAEILQYQCEIGMSQVVCNPFVRIFAKWVYIIEYEAMRGRVLI